MGGRHFNLNQLKETPGVKMSDFLPAVMGKAEKSGPGVMGIGNDGPGVSAVSDSGSGVDASSKSGEGIHAETTSQVLAAIAGFNRRPDGTGAAIYGEKAGDVGHAGFFKGNVHVTGNITTDGDVILSGADCAEEFDVLDTAAVADGSVMVLGDGGCLQVSCAAYDKKVAGVISGAGTYRPGIVLDRRSSDRARRAIALVGKVYCRVDASYGAIELGDLLTTSPTPGHAMKAVDSTRAFGCVLGKALRAVKEGQDLIPILVALQ